MPPSPLTSERHYLARHVQGSTELACPTDGCSGYITLAQVVPRDPKHEDFVFSKPRPQPDAPPAQGKPVKQKRGKDREGGA